MPKPGSEVFCLTGDERYLEPYAKSHAVILSEIEHLRVAAGAIATRQQRLGVVAEAAAAKLSELARTITIRKKDGLEAAIEIVRTGRGKDAMDVVRDQLTAPAPRKTPPGHLSDSTWRRPSPGQFLPSPSPPFWRSRLLFGVHIVSERSRSQLGRHASWLSTTLASIGDAVIATDGNGRVIFMNAVAEKLTGCPRGLVRGQPLDEVFRITNEATGQPVESIAAKVIREGKTFGLANHTVLTAADGTARPIEDRRPPSKKGIRSKASFLCFATPASRGTHAS